MTITHEFNIDVQQENYEAVRIPQYNKDSHILEITVTNNGQKLSLDSSAYEAYIKIAGAAGNYYNLKATITNTGVVTYVLPESVTAFSGKHQTQIDIIHTSDNLRLCTMPFVIYVTPSVYTDDVVIASNEYTSLTELLTTAQNLINRITAKIAQIDSMYTQMYKYKGSVPSEASLPIRNVEVGDVYNTENTGMNYAWNGTEWDALGQLININSLWGKDEIDMITSQEIDDMFIDE
jgi:hypothetical protein